MALSCDHAQDLSIVRYYREMFRHRRRSVNTWRSNLRSSGCAGPRCQEDDPMTRAIVSRAILSAALLLAAQLWAGGDNKPPASAAAPPAPPVTVARPLQKQITEWDEYTGRFA